MTTFQVDCWFSHQRPPSPQEWRRYVIAVPAAGEGETVLTQDPATEAELTACLWAGREGTRYVAGSVVVDWEGI